MRKSFLFIFAPWAFIAFNAIAGSWSTGVWTSPTIQVTSTQNLPAIAASKGYPNYGPTTAPSCVTGTTYKYYLTNFPQAGNGRGTMSFYTQTCL